MKIAFAGKGGVGKTTIAAWTGDYMARQGEKVWMVDADTAHSLGQASGLSSEELPTALVEQSDIINDMIGKGMLTLNPDVSHLTEDLAVTLPLEKPGSDGGEKKLLLMGNIRSARSGCACEANALLQAVIAHLILDRRERVLIDLEAGVEHLGRGTISAVDALVIVAEPSLRSLETAASIGTMASQLGLQKQLLVMNRGTDTKIPDLSGLPSQRFYIPYFERLADKQMESPSVLNLENQKEIDESIEQLLEMLL